ncbi:MAG: hypothetical protein D3924_06910, partial [Candidatus Electrothrix sp. AR4]|nr:hypothetical protein [Candidatus Electrothrix sp. AR4]
MNFSGRPFLPVRWKEGDLRHKRAGLQELAQKLTVVQKYARSLSRPCWMRTMSGCMMILNPEGLTKKWKSIIKQMKRKKAKTRHGVVRPQGKLYSIKKSIFISLLAGMITLGAVYLFSIFIMYKNQDTVRHQKWQEILLSTYQWTFDKDVMELDCVLDAVKINPAIQRQFINKNRTALMNTVRQLGMHLNQHCQISHFYFHGTDRVNFLRVHQPDRYGDRINRITLRQAVEKGKTVSG